MPKCVAPGCTAEAGWQGGYRGTDKITRKTVENYEPLMNYCDAHKNDAVSIMVTQDVKDALIKRLGRFEVMIREIPASPKG